MTDPPVRQQRRTAIRTNIDGIEAQSIEQHAFVQDLKHVLNNTSSTEAGAEAIIELLPPETLVCHQCLKCPLLYVTMRDVLRYVGLTVEQKQGLFNPQAVISAVYASDATLKNTASSYIANYRLAAGTAPETSRASDAANIPNIESGGGEHETTWRKKLMLQADVSLTRRITVVSWQSRRASRKRVMPT
jgi:hypothetical protein